MHIIIILAIVVVFSIIIIASIYIYSNINRKEKGRQIKDVSVTPTNENLSVDDKQAPESIISIIQPITENTVELKNIELTVKTIRYIRTTGQDEYYREKLLNQNWISKVEKIKNRDGYQCQQCYGLTLLDKIEEIKNYVDYPEVGEVVIDVFNNKELYSKSHNYEYKVDSCKVNGIFHITELSGTDIWAPSEKIDLLTTSPLNEEDICGYSSYINVSTSSFRYNVKDPSKKTNSIGIIYFIKGNTNNQLVLRNVEWYKAGLPYAKQGILTFNGFSIVYPLLTIKKKYLNVHHLAYYEDLEPWECPENELITLCHRCHIKAHEKEIPVKRIL